MIESVAVRQRGAYDFETHYNNLCALQNSCPLPAVKTHLPEGVLDINGDRIRAGDWVPILNTVRINKTLDFIGVRSYFQTTIDAQQGSDKGVSPSKRKIPAIRSKEITYRLCKSLRDCLCHSPTLSCLELQGLPLRQRDLGVLSKGVAKSPGLQHLSLEFCRIGDDGLENICKGIRNSASLTSVNFSGCGLSWKGADILAKVVKHQAMKRHNEAWQDSLRYRRPDLDRMAGIRRITVNYNPMLGDQGAAAFAEALKDDLWLKALDMQHCGLSNEGAKSLLDVLKYNTTMVVMDVRQNAMIDQDILRSIMEQVIINCNGQDTEYRWIKAEPLQDPAKAKFKAKKKTKMLQNTFGKKASIKVPSNTASAGVPRRRSRSTGSMVAGSGSGTHQAEEVRPEPGIPWRTAMRASRLRGYPPEGGINGYSYEDLNDAASPPISPKGGAETSIYVEHEDDTADSVQATRGSRGISQESDGSVFSLKDLKVEVEQLRRRFQEENEARSRAEEKLIELTVENSRLKNEVQSVQSKGSLLDDDRVLESIETSFKQFHSFLDLLRDAGLGQLITLAGLDESSMCIPSRVPPQSSPSPKARQASPPKSAHIDIKKPAFSDSQFVSSKQKNNKEQSPASAHSADGILTMEDLTGRTRDKKLIHPHILPQNYPTSLDPTMQGEVIRQGPKKAFDELYQQAIQDTQGSYIKAKGDPGVSVASNEAKTNVKSTAGGGDISHHSKESGSEHSVRSSHSNRGVSKHNSIKQSPVQSPPVPTPRSPNRSQGSGRKSAEAHDYSENFDVSEEIEDIEEIPDISSNQNGNNFSEDF